jgi:hypothetical protein
MQTRQTADKDSIDDSTREGGWVRCLPDSTVPYSSFEPVINSYFWRLCIVRHAFSTCMCTAYYENMKQGPPLSPVAWRIDRLKGVHEGIVGSEGPENSNKYLVFNTENRKIARRQYITCYLCTTYY